MSPEDFVEYVANQDIDAYENLLDFARLAYPKHGVVNGPSDLAGMVECLVGECGFDVDDLKDVADGF